MTPREGAPRQRPALHWAGMCYATTLLLSLSSAALGACPYPDTLYVDNTPNRTCGDGTCPSTAFCTIQSAINSLTSGMNRVIAVMGTSTLYREAVTIPAADSGLVLVARGDVTIDGAELNDPATNPWQPQFVGSTKLWSVSVPTSDKPRQVIMNGRRYPDCRPDCPQLNIPPGWSYYAAAETNRVYVNFINDQDPNHDYSTDQGLLCVRQAVKVRSSNVVVDGFKLIHSKFDAVLVDGATAIDGKSRNVTIRNCIIQESHDNGIAVTNVIRATLLNNSCSSNSGHGISVKSRENSSAPKVETCSIRQNTCFENNLQSKPGRTGSRNGIRLGNFAGPTTGDHTVEGNKVFSNQDSGIEVNASDGNTLRYNQSWDNGDHGYDHVNADNTVHVGDLAYGNTSDGFSNENNSIGTQVHNCVMVDNGRDPHRQDYELEVLGSARSSFVSDNNVIFRSAPGPGACQDWFEVGDTILVAWQPSETQDSCIVRCSNPAYCFGTVARFAAASGVNPQGNEVRSRQGVPAFQDASGGDFRPRLVSPMLDAADTTAVGWKTTDAAGFARYDCLGTANTGVPAGTYADIGPFEIDDGAPAVNLQFTEAGFDVWWYSRGEYGGTTPILIWDILVNGQVWRSSTETGGPKLPGQLEQQSFTVAPCSGWYAAQLLTYYHEIEDQAVSNTATGQMWCCTPPPCEIERPGGPSRAAIVEVEYPLGLEWPAANPSQGVGMLRWSVPRSQAGAAYDLSLFDVAGRKVSTIATGMARAGRFTQEVRFRSTGGESLPNGVFFLRLRVGSETLMKTLVLAR